MSFAKCFRKLERAINTSKKQALNRAVSSTKAKYAKEISADLGVTSARAKSRAKTFNATNDNQTATLSIGVRLDFAAHDFKPKKTKVQSKRGKRTGATYTVKGRPTVTVVGGFIVKGKNSGKNIIIQRVAGSKYPTKTVLVAVFKEAVQLLQPALQQHMLDTFTKNYSSNLSYNLSK